MSQIFNYINNDKITHVDDYEGQIIIYNFKNVLFRTQISRILNFHTPLGVTEDKKIISITNKQLSFLINKYVHFISNEYAEELKNTYKNIINANYNEIINEEVFLFFDYESISGTGHSYDLMFYLIYIYKLNNLNCKLLVVKSENKYYNSTLTLIKNLLKIEYIFIDPDKTYLIKNFNCARSYQNVFFNEVKEFINKNIIDPIIEHYDKLNTKFYKNIIKLKYANSSTLCRDNDNFLKTISFEKFLASNDVFDLNSIDDDSELKIYLLNKAETITVNWGSTYIININYHLKNTIKKKISVVIHKNIGSTVMLQPISNNIFKQHMPSCYCANIMDQVYNIYEFEGEVLTNVLDIDDYISRTKIQFF